MPEVQDHLPPYAGGTSQTDHVWRSVQWSDVSVSDVTVVILVFLSSIPRSTDINGST